MKLHICNFFSFSFLYFCVFILNASVAISVKTWDVFLSLLRDSSQLMWEGGTHDRVQQECRRKERSFTSPAREWVLEYENAACFPLHAVGSNSGCGAPYVSVLTQGTLVQPVWCRAIPPWPQLSSLNVLT